MKINQIKEMGINLLRFLKKHKWYALALFAGILYIIFDYYDFGILTGWGILSKQFKPNPIEIVVAILLLLTFIETLKTSKEALRQTELTLRPYLRLSWVATQIGDNRRDQGIIDTCIVVSNNGKGLMRQVEYNVEVDGEKVGVRNHSLIVANSSTNMVYDDNTDKAELALGCRNDSLFKDKNNEIIKKKSIKIDGSYRDIEGGEYSFSFKSNTDEQSWFRENVEQLPK